MSVEEALEFVDQRTAGDLYAGQKDYSVACVVLAEEVRKLRKEKK